MNRYLSFRKYTKNIGLMIKLPICFILNRLGLKEMATKILCEKPYILRTPFGNYLATTLFHYFCVVEDYEPQIYSLIDKISKNITDSDKYCINIGSNIGRWSIGLAKKYGYNVLSFEPTPSTYHNQKINIVLSNLDEKIELFNIGLGNTNDTIDFLVGDDCDTDAHVLEVNSMVNCKKNRKTIKIPVKRFDDLGLSKEKIEKIKLVIIDVEGFELNVLKGMEKTLRELNDINIVVEIRENNKNKEKTIQYMQNLGYKMKNIDSADYLFYK